MRLKSMLVQYSKKPGLPVLRDGLKGCQREYFEKEELLSCIQKLSVWYSQNVYYMICDKLEFILKMRKKFNESKDVCLFQSIKPNTCIELFYLIRDVPKI